MQHLHLLNQMQFPLLICQVPGRSGTQITSFFNKIAPEKKKQCGIIITFLLLELSKRVDSQSNAEVPMVTIELQKTNQAFISHSVVLKHNFAH